MVFCYNDPVDSERLSESVVIFLFFRDVYMTHELPPPDDINKTNAAYLREQVARLENMTDTIGVEGEGEPELDHLDAQAPYMDINTEAIGFEEPEDTDTPYTGYSDDTELELGSEGLDGVGKEEAEERKSKDGEDRGGCGGIQEERGEVRESIEVPHERVPTEGEIADIVRDESYVNIMRVTQRVLRPDTNLTAWRGAFEAERTRRDDALTALMDHLPEAECPPFDPDNIPDYLARARAAIKEVGAVDTPLYKADNRTPREVSETNITPAEITLVRRLVREYADADTDYLATLDNDKQREKFLWLVRTNAMGIALTERYITRRDFFAQRAEALQQFGFDMELDSTIAEQGRILPITAADIDEMTASVTSLQVTGPYPNFFSLDTAHQKAIISTIGEETKALYALVAHHMPVSSILYTDVSAGALAYRPAANLARAIELHPEVPPDAICHAFMSSPRTFNEQLQTLRRQARGTNRELFALSAAGVDLADQNLRKLSPNLQRMGELLLSPHTRKEVLSMDYGDAVDLSRPSTTTEEAELVTRSDLEKRVNENLALLARGIYQALPVKPDTVTMPRWDQFNVGKEISGGYYGVVSDIKMTLLPVTQEQLAERLNDRSLRPEDHYEVLITMNLRPTGKMNTPVPVAQRLMLRIHASTPTRGTIAKTVWHPYSDAADTVIAMMLESEEIGRRTASYALRHPLRGGLPGTRRG